MSVPSINVHKSQTDKFFLELAPKPQDELHHLLAIELRVEI